MPHLTKNGVDLDKYPVSLGLHLKFDPEREVFHDSEAATALVTASIAPSSPVPKRLTSSHC
ncbi:MAG: hypothetical protein R3C56_22110 [Pirellulaceae bacterium]